MEVQVPVAHDGLTGGEREEASYNKVWVVSTCYTVKPLAASILRALVSSATCRKRQVRGERRLP